ncbi:flagellar basal body-associated FliL family protein [Indioceanicola profundi]|uniref:flagellar basal body-associated FliL family protein n=1 Tax=Indioceanicola profundi TaxID=2220096 RepID=UPI000E6AB794|nr:flagellar basal body-associated FliL family protein [Indioceanicola profundi]
MAESTFDRMSKQLSPPQDGVRRRRLLIVAAAGLCAGFVGLGAGIWRDWIGEQLAEPTPAPTATFHQLADLTVNLRQTASVKLMKIGLTLRVPSNQIAELTALEPVIIDGLTPYLRQLDEHDLEGASGLEKLRADLIHRIRLLAEPVEVNDVLLRTLILQ